MAITVSAWNEFQTSHVVSACGVNRDRFQVWLREGWVRASKRESPGQGIKNVFSDSDLDVIYLFRQCIENGVHRTAVARLVRDLYPIAEELRKQWKAGEELIVLYFWRKGRDFVNLTVNDYKTAYINDADDCMVINYTKIMKHIEDWIEWFYDEDDRRPYPEP